MYHSILSLAASYDFRRHSGIPSVKNAVIIGDSDNQGMGTTIEVDGVDKFIPRSIADPWHP